MTKPKSTKRALLSSGLALIMCVSMLIGSTFAWFTDEATTGVNTIQSGNLDVALEMWDGEKYVNAEGETLNFIAADGNEDILWEPGCTYKLPALRVVNKGNLALKYKVVITGINGDAKLNEVIDWTIGTVAQGEEQHLAAGTKTDAFTISGTMKTTAGNAYQGLSIDGISITVYATQDTVEFDSNGNQYDQDATLPDFWDGKAITQPTLNKTDGKYHITSAAEFVAYIENTNTGNSYVLDRDIDLGGYTIDVSSGSRVCGSNFDGKNHTVSNFTLKGGMYTSLFGYMTINESGRTIENLIVRNATVIGGAQTSVILSAANKNDAAGAATVNNCNVYDSTIIGEKKVAPIVGYTESGTITNCYAENCTVYCADSRSEQAGEVVGYINVSGGHTDNTSDNTAKNVTVKTGASVTAVSNANDLTSAIANGSSVVLSGNITTGDNTNYGSNTVGIAVNGGVTLDGNGNTLSKGNSNGFAIITNGATIKNLTLKDSARAIFIDKITSDVVIDNVIINGAGYAINTGDKTNANAGLIVTNSTVNGWTSFANIASASFTNCSFGSSHYYEAEVYQHYLRPYISATFTGCNFDTGFYIDLTKLADGCTVTLENCTCNGVKLTNENFADYVKIIKSVVNGTDVYAANGDSLTKCIFQ